MDSTPRPQSQSADKSAALEHTRHLNSRPRPRPHAVGVPRSLRPAMARSDVAPAACSSAITGATIRGPRMARYAVARIRPAAVVPAGVSPRQSPPCKAGALSRLRLRAVGLANGDSYAFPITQAELADTVGVSAVHVNRSLQVLREAGLITLRSGQLVILDASRMQDFRLQPELSSSGQDNGLSRLSSLTLDSRESEREESLRAAVCEFPESASSRQIVSSQPEVVRGTFASRID
jgi:CRP-like cAMP-binding protein